MLAPALLALAVSVLALAGEPGRQVQMTDLFPERPLTYEEAAGWLVPANIGPPAKSYDQTTYTAAAASPEELAIEKAVLAGVGDPAPDSLRRFGRLELALRRQGTTHNLIRWFLAEHVGLATVPVQLGQFYTSSSDPEHVRSVVAGTIERDPELRSVAVTLEHDAAQDLWVGLVHGLYAAARFEPFPRVYRPGAVAVVPGTLLDKAEQYAIYVSFPGTEVRAFPLAGHGAFDVEIPLPSEPGVYRVAMNRQKKHELPDSAFFFSLYVGREPPTALDLPSLGMPEVADAGSPEATFLAAVNAYRARYQRAPLEYADRSADMRTLLAGLPERPLALWRYVRQISRRDPLPGLPHGGWAPAFTDGRSPEEAAWSAIEHPITRDVFLSDGYAQLTAGALTSPRDGAVRILAFAVAPADDVNVAREAAAAELRRRWPAGVTPTAAPKLQARLDVVAAEIASGKRSMGGAMKDLKGIVSDAMKAGLVKGGATWTVTALPPGQDVALETLAPTNDLRAFAVGAARGDLGRKDGFQYVVLVVVLAGGAE
ncbi:MAG: hypothetical protein ACOZNI_28750 [Myxococcota bacterium]